MQFQLSLLLHLKNEFNMPVIDQRQLPRHRVDRRPGDIAKCLANPSLAVALLGWKANLELQSMCNINSKIKC